jgi:transcription elongation factor Elf1
MHISKECLTTWLIDLQNKYNATLSKFHQKEILRCDCPRCDEESTMMIFPKDKSSSTYNVYCSSCHVHGSFVDVFDTSKPLKYDYLDFFLHKTHMNYLTHFIEGKSLPNSYEPSPELLFKLGIMRGVSEVYLLSFVNKYGYCTAGDLPSTTSGYMRRLVGKALPDNLPGFVITIHTLRSPYIVTGFIFYTQQGVNVYIRTQANVDNLFVYLNIGL